jgi:hypothetical protein
MAGREERLLLEVDAALLTISFVFLVFAERTVLLWQFPWKPESWSGLAGSPWLRMFENAFEFASQ